MTEEDYIEELRERWPRYKAKAMLETVALADEATRAFPRSPTAGSISVSVHLTEFRQFTQPVLDCAGNRYESGRGQPHSKTSRKAWRAIRRVSVLECGCPQPL